MRDRVRSVQRDMIIKQRVLNDAIDAHVKECHGGDDADPACFTCERCKQLWARDHELTEGAIAAGLGDDAD